MLKIYSREQWKAKYANGFGPRPLPAREVYLHHSVTDRPPVKATYAQDASAVRTLENIGQARFGHGISYNRVVCPSGRVFSGVSVDRIGSHTAGHNTDGVGVVLVGNYEKRELVNEQIHSLAALLRQMRKAKQVHSSAKYAPHSSVKQTACPGKYAKEKIWLINYLAKDNAEYTKKIGRGDKGKEVMWVQVRLINAGYNLEMTGVYDDDTYYAVRSFRRSKMNTPVLLLGSTVSVKTWNALRTR
jgi:hypothetical protein